VIKRQFGGEVLHEAIADSLECARNVGLSVPCRGFAFIWLICGRANAAANVEPTNALLR
jgi:hypothetical protein